MSGTTTANMLNDALLLGHHACVATSGTTTANMLNGALSLCLYALCMIGLLLAAGGCCTGPAAAGSNRKPRWRAA